MQALRNHRPEKLPPQSDWPGRPQPANEKRELINGRNTETLKSAAKL